MKKLMMLFFIAPLMVMAQQGTTFEKNVSLDEAKAKAKAENKYLFIDAYATWCVPCKMMDQNTFPNPEVGAFMNEKFVSTKFQMDQTEADTEEIKKLYPDGERILKEYGLRAYPSYFILSPAGELVHKFVGYHEPAQFLGLIKDAVDPNSQVITLKNKMDAELLDAEGLKNLVKSASATGNDDIAAMAFEKILPNLSDAELFEKENLAMVVKFAGSPGQKGFEIMKNETAKVDAVMGEGYVSKQIASSVLANQIIPSIQPDQPDKIGDFTKLAEDKIKEFSQFNIEKDVQLFQVQVYSHFKKSEELTNVIQSLVTKHQDHLSPMETNQLAWMIFETSENPELVKSMLAPMKKAVEKTESKEPALMDTYANLLHKSGQTEEAIKWQEKAINLVSGDEKVQYQEVLEKMKKGEKTW